MVIRMVSLSGDRDREKVRSSAGLKARKRPQPPPSPRFLTVDSRLSRSTMPIKASVHGERSDALLWSKCGSARYQAQYHVASSAYLRPR
jgi:hypothetical protein